jgi:hypothetical protein
MVSAGAGVVTCIMEKWSRKQVRITSWVFGYVVSWVGVGLGRIWGEGIVG